MFGGGDKTCHGRETISREGITTGIGEVPEKKKPKKKGAIIEKRKSSKLSNYWDT